MPFFHIESQLTTTIVEVHLFDLPPITINLPPDQYPVESTPEFSFVENVPTETPNPDITSPDYLRLEGEILNLPLRMESVSLAEANFLTIFKVDYYAYRLIPEYQDGFNPVSIQNILTTITGQEIRFPESLCYYAKSK